jgi:hypothetical protein
MEVNDRRAVPTVATSDKYGVQQMKEPENGSLPPPAKEDDPDDDYEDNY